MAAPPEKQPQKDERDDIGGEKTLVTKRTVLKKKGEDEIVPIQWSRVLPGSPRPSTVATLSPVVFLLMGFDLRTLSYLIILVALEGFVSFVYLLIPCRRPRAFTFRR